MKKPEEKRSESRNERFEFYFAELERLSIDDLDLSAARLALIEKRSTARLIAHLAEISRRKAELERGYSGLFEYCVRRLNLSEGSVALRIQVANVARRFPQILAALAEGKISRRAYPGTRVAALLVVDILFHLYASPSVLALSRSASGRASEATASRCPPPPAARSSATARSSPSRLALLAPWPGAAHGSYWNRP